MRGRVLMRRHGPRLDLTANLGSIISNAIILEALEEFLTERFGGGGGAVLDVGAGSKPYAPLYERHFETATSVDVPYSALDVDGVDLFASADDLPFADETFDCVICTEVLEHCTEPRAVLSELHRVLKSGGSAFVTTPFMVPLHDMPYDFFRYTPSALRDLAAGAGFVDVDVRPRGEYVAVALTVLLLPWTKAWQLVSRVLRTNLYHPYNPLVFATVLLPQVIYVRVWRRMRAGRVARKLSYWTLGYVTTMRKSTRRHA